MTEKRITADNFVQKDQINADNEMKYEQRTVDLKSITVRNLCPYNIIIFKITKAY